MSSMKVKLDWKLFCKRALIVTYFNKWISVGNGSVVSRLGFHPVSWGSNPGEREKDPPSPLKNSADRNDNENIYP